jgi:hypothetical protein
MICTDCATHYRGECPEGWPPNDRSPVRPTPEPLGSPADEPTATQIAEHQRHSALGRNYWITCPLCDDEAAD